VPCALITGISGQDGHYLAEFLHNKSYDVVGVIHDRHPDTSSVRRELPYVSLVYADLTDLPSLIRAYEETQPDEIYNLGSRSAVDLSFKAPIAALEVTGVGVLNALEAFRTSSCLARGTKFYQASSAEMFGDSGPGPYSESTPFNPQSPYAAAKVLAHQLANIYRQSYGIHISTGICFNHESPRRGLNFVTRKISLGVARIAAGLDSILRLGNLDTQRDWGFAGDYVAAMWLATQQSRGDDYVIATGDPHSVREFVEMAFAHAGIADWHKYVVEDERYFRPLDVPILYGDITKARTVLGWEPTVNFKQLVEMMIDADLALVDNGARSRG
jgi:GDPmannose 4,6-dehydratase